MDIGRESKKDADDRFGHDASIYHLATILFKCYYDSSTLVALRRDMREIPLTRGKVALVDDEDYEIVSHYRWQANRQVQKNGETWYAEAHTSRTQKPRRHLLMHRLILSAPPGLPVDHRNYDGLDNRRANLRLCTPAQNNAHSHKRRSLSCFRGVRPSQRVGHWCAYIKDKGHFVHLGHYSTEEEAARAYNGAAIKLFGEFATLNEVSDPLRVEVLR